MFNLVEGIIDHQILGIHHVRDDLPPGPAKAAWDIGFLVWGAIMLAAGWLLIHCGGKPGPLPAGPLQRARESVDRELAAYKASSTSGHHTSSAELTKAVVV